MQRKPKKLAAGQKSSVSIAPNCFEMRFIATLCDFEQSPRSKLGHKSHSLRRSQA